MDGGVTIGTTIGKKSLLTGCHDATMTGAMTLDAEKWHCRRQKSPVDCTVRQMAIHAVFAHITMLVNEWSIFFHVATCAEIPCRLPFEQLQLAAAMNLMAVKTGHLPLTDRVVTDLAE